MKLPKNPPKKFRLAADTILNHWSDISKHPKEYVLICGDRIVGYFQSYSVAINHGDELSIPGEEFLVTEVRPGCNPINAIRYGIALASGRLHPTSAGRQ
jgi:hypothetical protein